MNMPKMANDTIYDVAMRAADRLCPPREVRRNRNTPGFKEAYKAFQRLADPVVVRCDGTGADLSKLMHIKPVVRSDDKLHYIVDVDPYRQAFNWSPRLVGMAQDLDIEPLAKIKTLHRYGFHGFFKPSVAEVLCQIPAPLWGEVVAFETDGPDDVEDLNNELIAFDAGFQVAVTTLYRRSQ